MSLESLHGFATWTALVAHLFLSVFLIVAWARKLSGRVALIAAVLTALHFIARALTGFGFVTLTLHTLALLAWIGLLAHTIGVSMRGLRDASRRIANVTFGFVVCIAGLLVMQAWDLSRAAIPPPEVFTRYYILNVMLAVAGLVFVEQVMTNALAERRARARHLEFGLGILFLYQLLLNASGLLGGAVSSALIAVEPLVFALVAPCIAVTTLRNRTEGLQVNLSRQLIFRVGTLVYAGAGLFLLGVFGYLTQAFSGDWRLAIATLLTVVALMGLVVVFGSSSVRAWGRKLLEEHVFRRKYDYRDEWLRASRQLTAAHPDYDLPQQVIRSLARVVMADGGAIWTTSEAGPLLLLRTFNSPWQAPIAAGATARLREWFESNGATLDLYRLPADLRERLRPDQLADFEGLRFIVPLTTESGLFGVVGLARPPVTHPLSWEDHDLLALIAREAAGYVALQRAERALADADRLSGFNQVAAFVVHDAKTIAAQLSLLLSNAERHRSNPAFVDDMLRTVENSVKRIHHLLGHLQGTSTGNTTTLPLEPLVARAIEPYLAQHPRPVFEASGAEISVRADAAQLGSALGHVLQNAIEAAQACDTCAPTVRVAVRRSSDWAEIHIEDSGAGMDPAFVEQRLFQPLASTKGVSGMGLGAYQARTYLRSLGGDVSVDTAPGRGTRFILRLPMEPAHA